jgi:hypothetical protein
VSAKPSRARRAMLEVLADGGWHTSAELLAAGSNAVPPGFASRVGERSRLNHPGAPLERRLGDQSTAIASGARAVARKALWKLAEQCECDGDGDRYRLLRGSP